MSYSATETERARFTQIAEMLIPSAEGMPGARDVEIAGETLDRVLTLRPDLVEDFRRGLASDLDAQALNDSDPAALTAIGAVASAIYYMNAEVRARLGYPGQTHRPVLTGEEEDWRRDGLLDPVIARGPIYRDV